MLTFLGNRPWCCVVDGVFRIVCCVESMSNLGQKSNRIRHKSIENLSKNEDKSGLGASCVVLTVCPI